MNPAMLVSIDSSEEPVVVGAILRKARCWVLEFVLNSKDVPPNSNAMNEALIRFWLLLSHVGSRAMKCGRPTFFVRTRMVPSTTPRRAKYSLR